MISLLEVGFAGKIINEFGTVEYVVVFEEPTLAWGGVPPATP